MNAPPRVMRPFTDALAPFDEELRHALAPLLPRLSALWGPMARLNLPTGAPDGFSGLDRRGPYDRLIASEWAVALEIPDEFLRRATMSEHLFLAPQLQEPAGALRSLVLLDGGPDQLGAPRVIHLAALLVAQVRAQKAKAELAWSALTAGPPRVLDRIDATTAQAFLDARRPSLLDVDTLEHWRDVLSSFDGQVEVTCVGGAALLARIHADVAANPRSVFADARVLVVQPALDAPKPALDLTLHHSSARARVIRFVLPGEEVVVRALRSPLMKPPVPDGGAFSVDAQPHLGLTVPAGARRLFVRTGTGVASLPAVNSPRQKLEAMKELTLQQGDLLVACGVDGKQPIALVQRQAAFLLVARGARIPLALRGKYPLVLLEQVRPLVPVPLPHPPADDTPHNLAPLTSPVPRVFVDDQGTAFAFVPYQNVVQELKRVLAAPPAQFSQQGRLWLEIANDEPTQRGQDLVRGFNVAWPRDIQLGAVTEGGDVPGALAQKTGDGRWKLWRAEKAVEIGGVTEAVLCAVSHPEIGPALVAARGRTLHIIGHAAREKVAFAADVVSAAPHLYRHIVYVGCADGSVHALFFHRGGRETARRLLARRPT